RLNPPPTRKIPVLIGGSGEKKTLRLVAKHADIWHSFSDAARLEQKLGVLAGHAADVGRDMSEIEISTEIHEIGPEDVKDIVDLGTTLFTYGTGGPDYDFARLSDWLAWRDEQNAA
ncbi:MAG: class F420-dependent oxidoreductase, partial [Microbacteriaceae bacterium]|nr:class F420-dependent oxidoreductase [Microbacteriaceae bacterium]